PRLRNSRRTLTKPLDRVSDEVNQDGLLQAGFDATALEKARALVQNSRQFIDERKDELDALKLLYSVPHRRGLRYRHLKELADVLKRPPLAASPQRRRHASEPAEPAAVQ